MEWKIWRFQYRKMAESVRAQRAEIEELTTRMDVHAADLEATRKGDAACMAVVHQLWDAVRRHRACCARRAPCGRDGRTLYTRGSLLIDAPLRTTHVSAGG